MARRAPAPDTSESESQRESESESREEQFPGGKYRHYALLCCWCSSCCALISVVSVYLFLNAIVALAITGAGRYALGVKTAVARVKVDLRHSRVEIRGLSAANPKGFAGSFLELDRVVFDMRAASFFADALELQELSVTGLGVAVERRRGGECNVKDMMDRVMQVVPAHSGSQDTQLSRHAMDRKVIAHNITLTNITARACVQPACDLLGPLQYRLTDIVLQEWGQDEGGSTLLELIVDLVGTIAVKAIEGAPQEIYSNLHNSAGHLVQAWKDRTATNSAVICNRCPDKIELYAYDAMDYVQALPASRKDIVGFTGERRCATLTAKGAKLYVWVKQGGVWHHGGSKWGFAVEGGTTLEWDCTHLRASARRV